MTSTIQPFTGLITIGNAAPYKYLCVTFSNSTATLNYTST